MSISSICQDQYSQWSDLNINSLRIQGATASPVNYDLTTTWTGATTSGCTINIVKTGSVVTLTCSGATQTTFSNSTLICSSTLPTAYRPLYDTYMPICVQNNSTDSQGLVRILSSTGTIAIGTGSYTPTAFTAATGQVRSFTVTYKTA